ncbi:hypothetical protein ACQ4PT_006181 [Festuca glaucescens]
MEEEAQRSEGGDDEMEDAEEDTDPDDTTASGAGDDTTDGATGDDTTDGAAGDDTTNGGERTDGSQLKRQRKDRRPNVPSTIKKAFTEVSASGHPLAPDEFIKGYGAQIGCILRSTVSINIENLRHPDRGNIRSLLFMKLHERYKFPDKYVNTQLSKNKVYSAALTKMSTALATWRAQVKKMILQCDSYDKIKETNPTISEEDYREYKIKCESTATAQSSQWGTDMQSLNIGIHTLGPGGYRAAQPKWDKEDAKRAEKKLPPLFEKFPGKQTRKFLWSWYHLDPKTKELTADLKVNELERYLEAESSSTGSQSSMSAPWDNPFNRAMNLLKKDKSRP